MVARGQRLSRSKRALFSLLVAVVFLGTAEGIARVVVPRLRRAALPAELIQAHTEAPVFRYDPDLLWFWASLPHGEVNEHGFRSWQKMAPRPSPGVTRVVTLGDSQTFGFGVLANQSYSAVAGRRLGFGWEVLNTGVNGYTSLNVYRLLLKRIHAFEPHVIVVDCPPFDSERDEGGLVAPSLGVNAIERLLWHSALVYLARHGWQRVSRAMDRGGSPADSWRPPGARGLGNHERILEWGRAMGIEVLFLDYPTRDLDRRIVCRSGPDDFPAGAQLVESCQALRDGGHLPQELFIDRNHLTVLGNQVVGQVLADELTALGPRSSE